MKRNNKNMLLIASVLLTVLLALAGCKEKSAPVTTSPSGTNTAEGYPKKVVQIIIAARAGGDTDAQGRRFAKYLEIEFGKPVVIVNMPGASSTIGSTYVLDADPDGYTVNFLNPETFGPRHFGLSTYGVADFEIAGIGAFDDTLVFCTRKGSPYPTLDSLVKAAKANPGKIELPAMQPGGYSFMSAVLFERSLGVRFNLTDIASNNEKIVQLLAGKIDVMGNQYGFVQDYITNGDFIPYCLLADERNPGFPDVPTLKELGYDSIGITTVPKYFYFAMPKNTDKAIVNKFAEALKKVTENPEYIAEAEKVLTTVRFMGPEEATAFMMEQENVYARIAKLYNEESTTSP
jgi:tripartite-type tricarboxylate transporter receptor subunit TctC